MRQPALRPLSKDMDVRDAACFDGSLPESRVALQNGHRQVSVNGRFAADAVPPVG